jgi:hypothetical protein
MENFTGREKVGVIGFSAVFGTFLWFGGTVPVIVDFRPVLNGL